MMHAMIFLFSFYIFFSFFLSINKANILINSHQDRAQHTYI